MKQHQQHLLLKLWGIRLGVDCSDCVGGESGLRWVSKGEASAVGLGVEG